VGITGVDRSLPQPHRRMWGFHWDWIKIRSRRLIATDRRTRAEPQRYGRDRREDYERS
jgi:hypothetical protein